MNSLPSLYKRGRKPQGKVHLKWNADFAYAIGLIATDGCLTGGRMINLTSKDLEMVENLQRALSLNCHVGRKARGGQQEKKYYVLQIGDILFYRFLNSIGITTNKSKTIGRLKIPDEFFFDFLRGAFDGDGCTYSYWDKRWRSSFMFYLTFASASQTHAYWLRETINRLLNVNGHVSIYTQKGKATFYQLRYAKNESLKVLKAMYHSDYIIYLSRKKLKIDMSLGIVNQQI